MLLTSDLLVIDQVTSVFRSDFAIKDAQGDVVGQIRTDGGIGSRMLVGNRAFSIYDATGQLALQLRDVMNLGRDTFDVIGPDGTRLAKVVKQITLFRPKLSVKLSDDSSLDVRGDFFDFNYTIDANTGTVAQVSRKWPSITGVMLGRDRYVLAFAPGTPPALRAAVIGTTIALDLIRAKDRDKDE